MPLTLFQHDSLRCFREVANAPDRYGHTFGGDPIAKGLRFVNLDEPFHLLYHLNLADPAVGIQLPGVTWLPLCYGFGYSYRDADFIYRVPNDMDVELIAPNELVFDPDSPYDNYPAWFPESSLHFAPLPYDPKRAEDALSLAAILGIEHLPPEELQRAIQLVDQEGLLARWKRDWEGWEPEDLVRCMHKEPFMQGPPSKSCDNPDCTAEIEYRSEPYTHTIPEDLMPHCTPEERTIHMEARDVRRASKRVFALHQPAEDERLLWHDPFVQLIWDICEECGCISVTNQCT